MRSKKVHSAQIFGVSFFLVRKSYRILRCSEERGRETRKNFGEATLHLLGKVA